MSRASGVVELSQQTDDDEAERFHRREDGGAGAPIYRTNAFHDGIPFEASAFRIEIEQIIASGDSAI